jgi:hypothetical protein
MSTAMEGEKPNLNDPKNPPQTNRGLEVFTNPNIEELTRPETEKSTVPAKKVFSFLPKPLKISKRFALIATGLLLIPIVGTALVLGITHFIGPNTLHFIPDSAEFYLGISVRKHPQVQKLKKLTEKFPGGAKIVEEPNQFRSELFGAPKDPFEDIVRLAEKEIFLAKISDDSVSDSNGTGTTSPGTTTGGSGLEKLINVVEMDSPKLANEKLNNFKEDKTVYTTTTQSFEEHEIFNIKLNPQGSDSQQFDLGAMPYSVTLPYSQSVYASTVDKFILSAEKLSDLKKSLSLSKTANPLNFSAKNNLKNILSDKDHKEIAKFFPKEYLVKFYQQKPLEPFANLIPISSISQTFMFGYDTLQRVEGKNYIEVNRGLVVTAHDDGIRMNSYQLDWRTPKEGLKNPYKIKDSLANRLPEKYSGLSPAIFAETNNYKDLMIDQEQILKGVSEKSDNRNQRKEFKDAVKGFDEFKSTLRSTFGVDPDKDIFSWMDNKVATIINAGAKNKAPELLIVAEIKGKDKVEKSLKKIALPNYIEEANASAKKRAQESNIRQIATGLEAYRADNLKYPNSLAELKPVYLKSIPKDTLTGTAHKYTVSSNRLTARVEGKSPDGRVVFYSSQTGTVDYEGAAKSSSIKKLTPTKSTYKGFNLYSIKIFDQAGVKYSMFFTVTNKLAVVSFGDKSQSIKDIIDFEKKPGKTLSSREAWKDQFDRVTEDVGGLIYMEPIQFFGTWEYFRSSYSEYSSYIDNISDAELVLKGYLATIPSIGTTVTKEKPVYATKTFMRIKELPKAEKKKAEDAFFRLRDENKKRSSPVLGSVSVNFTNVAKDLRDLIFP